jgi:uncharacterized glyoxalase superfamily protein PhnB
VSVTQTIVPGGERGLFFWPAVLRWLPLWHERGERPPGPREIARVSLAIHYRDPAEAARWLARVFGLGSWSGVPSEGEEPGWIELHHGNVAIVLVRREDGEPGATPVTHVPWVYVDDLDAHFAAAQAARATIVSGIEQRGFRTYAADDLEGYRWTVVHARPMMD